MPEASFNIDVRIFKETNEILDPLKALTDIFVLKINPLTELQQDVFDEQLRNFLIKFKRSVNTDKETVMKVRQMPFTTLTLREQGELQRLQKKQYGDLFERGLKGL